jgi:hypothetical protein
VAGHLLREVVAGALHPRRAPLAATALLALALTLALALALAEALASGRVSGAPPAQPLRIRYADGSSETLAVDESDGATYISSNDASRILGAVRYWDARFFQMDFAVEGRRARVTLGNAVALVNDAPVLLSGPVRAIDGVLWVPVDLVTAHLVPFASNRAEWIPARNEFRLGGARPNVAEIRTLSSDEGVSVDIRGPVSLLGEASLEEGRALVVSLPGAVLPAEAPPLRDLAQVVASIEEVAQAAGASLYIVLDRDFESASFEPREDPPGAVVRLRAFWAADSMAGVATDGGAGAAGEDGGAGVAGAGPSGGAPEEPIVLGARSRRR